MSVEEKIARIKAKAAKLAVKAAAVATLMTGAGAASSCDGQGQNATTDENKDKIENVKTEKTSVVFRAEHMGSRVGCAKSHILLEDGSSFYGDENSSFLEAGDTVTYEPEVFVRGNDTINIGTIKAVRYKGDAEVKKKVDFGKIGKIGKDITD